MGRGLSACFVLLTRVILRRVGGCRQLPAEPRGAAFVERCRFGAKATFLGRAVASHSPTFAHRPGGPGDHYLSA